MSRPKKEIVYSKKSFPRGVEYNKLLADAICAKLLDGENLIEICKDIDYPTYATVMDWVVRNLEGFGDRYEKAKTIQLYYYADELLLIVNAALRHDISIVEAELAIRVRQWLCERLKPEIYSVEFKRAILKEREQITQGLQTYEVHIHMPNLPPYNQADFVKNKEEKKSE